MGGEGPEVRGWTSGPEAQVWISARLAAILLFWGMLLDSPIFWGVPPGALQLPVDVGWSGVNWAVTQPADLPGCPPAVFRAVPTAAPLGSVWGGAFTLSPTVALSSSSHFVLYGLFCVPLIYVCELCPGVLIQHSIACA